MRDYAFTQHRIFQWLGILFSLGLIAVGYWYFSVRASTLNQSQNDLNTTGLVGLWSFNGDDMSGTTAYDRSGTGANGTLTGNAAPTKGLVGQAVDLDGSGDYVSLSDNAAFDLGGAASWCLWFYSDATLPESSALFMHDDASSRNSGTYKWIAAYLVTNRNQLQNYVRIGGTAYFATGPSYATGYYADAWHHVCSTFDKTLSSARLKIYINGVLSGSADAANGDIDAGGFPEIGRWDGNAGGYFNGKIDEVRMYNRALSANDIKALYDANQSNKTNSSVSQPQGTGRLDSGLAGYWRLDDGSGNNASDSSTNNNGMGNIGTAGWTTGQIGGATTMTDANAFNTSDKDVYDVADGRNFTLTGWFNRSSYVGDDTIFSKRDGISAGNTGYIIYIDDTTDKVTFEVSDGTDEYQLESASTFTATGWHHYAIVWDESSASNTRVYINGVAEAVTATGTFGNINSLANSANIAIGSTGLSAMLWNGQLDEIRFYDRALSGDEVAQLYRLSTPTGVDTSLKGYWSFNAQDLSGTTAYDRSGAGNTGTLTSSPPATQGQVGQSLSFNGSTQYISVTQSSSLNTFTALAVSAWVYPTVVSGNYIIVRKNNDTGGTNHDLYQLDISSNKARFLVAANGSGVQTAGNDTVLTANAWYHLVGTWDGTTARLYINQVQEPTTDSLSGTIATSTSNSLQIGRTELSTAYFSGKIDEVRIYNRALAASEITSLYAQGSSDKTNSSVSQPQGTGRLDSGLAGYWRLDDGSGSSATDSSTSANTGTLTNFPGSPTWTTGQIGGALDFDGTDDYIDLGTTLTSASAITVSAWVKGDANVDGMPIIGSINGEQGSNFQCLAYDNSGSENLSFGNVGGGTGGNVTVAVTGLGTTWHHVVYTNQGTRNRIYLDGALMVESNSAALTTNTESNVQIGRCVTGGGTTYFNGPLDEVRVYSRAISADEVVMLYRLTAPTGVDTSLKGYWSFNGQDVSGTSAFDRSGAGNTGTLTSGPVRTIGRIGQAIDLDGVDDEVSVPDVASLRPGSGDWSVAVWAQPPNVDQTTGVVGKRQTGTPFEQWGIAVCGTDNCSASGKKITFLMREDGANHRYFVTSSNVADGNWHHIVAVANSGANTVELYIDGVAAAGTQTTGGSWPTINNTDPLKIGSSNGSGYFDGKIDEVRVYNRVLTAAEVAALYNSSR